MDKNEAQRLRRRLNNNSYTKKYEKTKSGFLMRLYRNMQSRVTGVQRKKLHLYAFCSLLSREEFYKWANDSREFHLLFENWKLNEYKRTLTPSVDRVDSFLGYELSNMEWVTHSENSRRGSLNQHYGDWRSYEAKTR